MISPCLVPMKAFSNKKKKNTVPINNIKIDDIKKVLKQVASGYMDFYNLIINYTLKMLTT